MDLNAGTILEGEDVDTVGDRFFEYALQVASGEKPAARNWGWGTMNSLHGPWDPPCNLDHNQSKTHFTESSHLLNDIQA